MPEKDYFWLHLRELPYFRALIRGVEASYYQHFDLPGPVLDVGCGDGHFAELTFDRPLDVGIDPWVGPLKKAAARENVYDLLVRGDASKNPFPDGYFSSAISNSVLEHIPHIDAVLKDTARVLKPGAVFLFCVPNTRYFSELHWPKIFGRVGLKKAGDWYKEWFRVISRVEHADEPDVWEARLDRAGFDLERWWHYFSPEAMRTLEWGHYFGLPSLLIHAISRRWLLAPKKWNLALTARIIRPYGSTEAHDQGTFTFYVARRR